MSKGLKEMREQTMGEIERISVRGNIKYQGPEVGWHLECVRTCKQESVSWSTG